MATDIHLSILDRLEIAAPCHMRWDDMKGDDRVRYCDACSLHVHNISGMTRAEAEAFLARSLPFSDGGQASSPRVCGRFFRRADGTILTADCPIGLRERLAAAAFASRARLRRIVALGALALTATLAWATRSSRADVAQLQPFAALLAWLEPSAAPAPRGVLMGDMAGSLAVPPPPAAPSTTPSTTPAAPSASRS